MLNLLTIAAIMMLPMIAGGITFWLSIKVTEETQNENVTNND